MRPLVPRFTLAILAALGVGGYYLQIDHLDLAMNILVIAGLAIIAFAGSSARGRMQDLPFPRNKWIAPALTGAAAILTSARSLWLPYMADDFCLINDHGMTDGFWDGVFAVSNFEIWFRPVFWLFWKLYHILSPESGMLSHAVSIVIFAINAALVAPVLRRCGVPRGIATAAGIIFALSPAALDTMAWSTNLGTLLASTFSLASILCIARTSGRIINIIFGCGFATLAFLSKEESFLLPLWIFLATLRMRRSRVRAAIRRAAPALATAIIIFCIRLWVLRGAGGYIDDSTGETLLIKRILAGPLHALRSECPAKYLLPSRYGFHSSGMIVFMKILPLLVLLYGCASRNAGRIIILGTAIIMITLAPVSSMLPIGETLVSSRWLYSPTIGISVISAALLAGARPRRSVAWIPIGIFAILSIFISHRNFEAWRKSGELTNQGMKLMGALRAEPPNTTLWPIGLPMSVDGAQCFNCGLADMIRRSAKRYDLRIVCLERVYYQLDKIIHFDLGHNRFFDIFDRKPDAELAAGGSVDLDLSIDENTNHINKFCCYESSIHPLPRGGIGASGTSEFSMVFFQVVRVNGVHKISIDGDAKLVGGPSDPEKDVQWIVLSKTKDTVIRDDARDARNVELPAGAEYIILACRAIDRGAVRIRNITIKSIQ